MAKKPTAKQKGKIEKVMSEYKLSALRSGKKGPGKGPVVKSKKQAVAIALSSAGLSKKKKK